MKIKFLGAAGTVTGSSYALTSGSGQSILIDLGMFQGVADIDRLNYEPFDYDCSRLTGVVLTHAHLDHCGRLPILLPKGFKQDIWMTAPTRDLTELSLLDSASLSKHHQKHALFDKNLATKTIRHFKRMDYHTPVPIGDFMVTMVDAGHILGSASLEVIDTKPNSETKKIVFSGDLGNSPEDLVCETELIDSADVVIMESTYGDSLHPQEDPKEIVQSEINTVEKSGGTLLIPAFSLERTQELLHIIKHLKEAGKILPQTPVIMDSPMAGKATDIYMNYPELFNTHTQSEVRVGKAFEFPGISYENTDHPGVRVIIAGSGMMTGGRILEHALKNLPLATTRLLIVGYQGEGTLGRELLAGKRQVVVNGKSISVAATIKDTQAMSSHADQQQLMSWLAHIKNVKRVFLTHGEDGSRATLAKEITAKLGLGDIVLPKLNQSFDL
ncbi:MAG: MBL fold metallo-hydrolase [bacterium]|nr:MBL fold metallo-hydrolase [bacterium]